MLRDSVEDSTESKFSPAHFWENRNFDGLAGEIAKHQVKHFNNEDILKKEDEDYLECNDDSLTNNVELKTESLKTEEDIDVIYEDVKPEIYKSIGTEIGPNFSHELSIDSWPQQNIDEDGTAVERDNYTTVTIDSKNYQMIQNSNWCKFRLKAELFITYYQNCISSKKYALPETAKTSKMKIASSLSLPHM
ncbi:hypothetical protein JTB14_023796 [Gonioctena quinquepunctata]|nr:hypothetical protein JTB14_023796 [Gonioctena quinquepunctata]